MKFIKNFKKFLAFVFSFFIFVPNFSPSICAMGDVNILIVGKPGAGKSTLLYRFIKQNFDKPIDPKEVSTYEHGKIYTYPVDARFKIAEMDFEDESLVPEYKDYLYQNAHIIIHLSNIGKEPPPTKKDVSKWYDEFVRTIFRGLGDPRGHGKDFRANPEDISYCNKWFSPLQLGGKIGYIIFAFNRLDDNSTFDTYSNCRELLRFIDDFPNSRSILTFNCISSCGKYEALEKSQSYLVTLDEWVRTLASLARFESYDEDKMLLIEKKKIKYKSERLEQLSYRELYELWPEEESALFRIFRSKKDIVNEWQFKQVIEVLRRTGCLPENFQIIEDK